MPQSTVVRAGISSTTCRPWRTATPARSLWTRTELRPSDVQMLQAYDGFSFLTMSWLEALGLCKVGESGPFVDGGTRIARDGQLPLNTHGGQLSAGRLHGYGFLHEAATQMWGQGGERQIPSDVEIGIAAPAAATPAGACSSSAIEHRAGFDPAPD